MQLLPNGLGGAFMSLDFLHKQVQRDFAAKSRYPAWVPTTLGLCRLTQAALNWIAGGAYVPAAQLLFNFQLGGRNTSTIPVALFTSLYDGGATNWPYVASLGTAYVLPLAILIFFFQKYLLVGMTFGTVRGEV